MQKKSLLVALFCGALCLTGCLKNEESDSVRQVRLGKAAELNSLAKLNDAKAQAELIYANAEATLKTAQAALLNAQAETERIRAELLKVQVKLAEVKVEEEKVVLAQMQAELEVALARAEADKQRWANILNNLIADAEVQALQNAQEIMQAEADMRDFILSLEADKAEKAKEASDKYFAALQQVQEKQAQQLIVKATKALVESGAVVAKKAIAYQVENINKQIAENEAMIAALKARQTMTPEEAEAALKEARLELSDAYAAYQAAIDNRIAADNELNDLWNKQAQFNENWWVNFGSDVDMLVGGTVAELIKPEAFEKEGLPYSIWAEGVYDENGDFVPLWNTEFAMVKGSLYPGGEVYNPADPWFGYQVIAPATINYDNIAAVLTLKADEVETEMAEAVADFEDLLNAQAEIAKQNIEERNARLALHQKYVDARKDAVKKAEDDFLKDLDKKQDAESAMAKAWNEFQEYWLLKYDASRQVIMDRYDAEQLYNEKKAVSDAKKTALDNKKASIAGLKTAAVEAKAAEAKAEGAYNVALAEIDPTDKANAEAKVSTKQGDYDTAKAAVAPAKTDMETKKTILEDAEEQLVRNPKGSAGYATAKANYDTAKGNYDTAVETYNDAVEDESKAKKALENAQKELDDILAPSKNAKKIWDDALKARSDAEKAVTDAEADVVAGGKTYDEWSAANGETIYAKGNLDTKEAAVKTAIGEKNDPTATEKYGKFVAAAEEAAAAGASYAKLQALYFSFNPDEIDDIENFPAENYYGDYSNKEVFSWINSNYQLDVNATMLDANGEEVLIAENVFGWGNLPWEPQYACEWDDDMDAFYYIINWEEAEEELYGPYWNTLSFQNAEDQALIDAVPELIADAQDYKAGVVEAFQKSAAEVLAAVNEYKAKEASYLAWVADREDASKVVMAFEIAEYEAQQEYIAIKADYQALVAVADGGVFYIYDDENDDFEAVSINDAIYNLQGGIEQLYVIVGGLNGAAINDGDVISDTLNALRNFELNGTSIFELKLALKIFEKLQKVGKVAYQEIIEMLDQQIDALDEQIELYTKVANTYKAIMYTYLDIDPNGGETPSTDEE